MLHGINNNGDNNILNSQLLGQDEITKVVTNPIENTNPYSKTNKAYLIDESAISKDAYALYQRECDVKQFTKLATSNPEDLTHDDMVKNLFSKGIIDPFTADDVSSLVTNEKFLQDIEF